MVSGLLHKRILITGANGFVGANLTRSLLKTGAELHIFTRKTSNKWRISDILKDLREYEVELSDYQTLEKNILNIKPEIILHTAAYGGYSFQTETGKIIEANFMGTVNLINASKRIDFEIFINSGSSSEYGIKSEAMKESDMLAPLTDYGTSKAAATLYCQALAKSQGQAITTLRLFSPYGYYEEANRLIPSVILSCMRGESPKVSSGEPVRDFVFIEDVIAAYMKAIENRSKVRGEIFNIGSGSQNSVSSIIAEIIKLTGKDVSPDWGSLPNPRIEPPVWIADISKAKKILNWMPAYKLEEGLKKTIEWFKENPRLYKSDSYKIGIKS